MREAEDGHKIAIQPFQILHIVSIHFRAGITIEPCREEFVLRIEMLDKLICILLQ